MSYSITDCFMFSFAAGLIFALVYEALRLVRVVFPFRAVTFICDIAFFVFAAFAVTKLSVALGNHIRFYTLLGFGSGVFAYITTVGRLLNVIENAVAGAVRKVLSSLFSRTGRLLHKLFGAIAHTGSFLFGEINKISLRGRKKLRKHLPKRSQMVYNKESRKVDSGGSGSDNVIQAKVRRGNSA